MRVWGKWKASYTVEAAMVFPILFAAMVFLLFLTFYSHDIVVQKAVCYETALEAVYGGTVEDYGTVRCIRPSAEELSVYAEKRVNAGIIDGRERTILLNLTEKEKQVCIEGREYSEAVCEDRDTSSLLQKVRRIRIMADMVKEELTKGTGEEDEK